MLQLVAGCDLMVHEQSQCVDSADSTGQPQAQCLVGMHHSDSLGLLLAQSRARPRPECANEVEECCRHL